MKNKKSLRILWVFRVVTNDAGGDAVVDGKLVRELRRHHHVETIGVGKNPLRRRLLRILTRVLPPDRAGYGTSIDVANIASKSRDGDVDAIIISHEHLDYLAGEPKLLQLALQIPIILIHHNITSSAMNEIFGGLKGRIVQHAYRFYEQRCLARSNVSAHIVLSINDRRLLGEISGRDDIVVIAPGAPPLAPLAENAVVAAEFVLLGTYDWYPKRWSLESFVEEWITEADRSTPIYVDHPFPEWATSKLDALPSDGLNFENVIRFGILTDRFMAGHKLKTAAYLMANCVVLSFTDVAEDYRFSAHADFFIRRIRHVRDIRSVVAEFASIDPKALRTRFIEFKADISTNMSWEKQAHELTNAVEPLIERI